MTPFSNLQEFAVFVVSYSIIMEVCVCGNRQLVGGKDFRMPSAAFCDALSSTFILLYPLTGGRYGSADSRHRYAMRGMFFWGNPARFCLVMDRACSVE